MPEALGSRFRFRLIGYSPTVGAIHRGMCCCFAPVVRQDSVRIGFS